MPRTIRFHLDEHVDPAIAAGLRRRGINASTTRDVGLVSASDEAQLQFTRSTGRVLVTFDRGFLALAALGADHPGIAFGFQGGASIGTLIHSLELIWELLDAHEMLGRVEYL